MDPRRTLNGSGGWFVVDGLASMPFDLFFAEGGTGRPRATELSCRRSV